ncbi:MAG TPA: hypothetical protein VN025_04865 [Candidatus Dormibacteraeota bacterium]|jgi:hypothetical protein|nr:hypothetical protein [Candidatus Dormibacteraeota bacterium]
MATTPMHKKTVQKKTAPKKIGPWLAVLFAGMWLVAAALGQRVMLNYDYAAGTPGAAPKKWPVATQVPRTPGLFSIVVFAHPHCPCTRATVEELARLMAVLQNRATATVVFVRPAGLSEEWEKTDLWRDAARIPGASVVSDVTGMETSLFGAQASGQTMLYDAAGNLRFSGGITASRGHAGDSAGRSAILSVVYTGDSGTSRTSVYGCSLHNPERAEKE